MSVSLNPLLVRILSALVAIGLLALAYYLFHTNGLLALVYFVVAYGSREYLRMFFSNATKGIQLLLWLEWLILFTIGSSGSLEERSVIFLQIFAFAILFQITTFLIVHKKLNDIQTLFKHILHSLLGLIYLVFFPVCVAWILKSSNGSAWFFIMLLIVFSCDIGAFFAGKYMGKRKLAPLLSPKKTVEGAIGGFILSNVVALSCQVFLPHVSWPTLLLIGCTSTVLAIAGDFFESLMKRISDVKDTGGFMPGHGGVLDRIDSVLFAAPFYFVMTQILS